MLSLRKDPGRICLPPPPPLLSLSVPPTFPPPASLLPSLRRQRSLLLLPRKQAGRASQPEVVGSSPADRITPASQTPTVRPGPAQRTVRPGSGGKPAENRRKTGGKPAENRAPLDCGRTPAAPLGAATRSKPKAQRFGCRPEHPAMPAGGAWDYPARAWARAHIRVSRRFPPGSAGATAIRVPARPAT